MRRDIFCVTLGREVERLRNRGILVPFWQVEYYLNSLGGGDLAPDVGKQLQRILEEWGLMYRNDHWK